MVSAGEPHVLHVGLPVTAGTVPSVSSIPFSTGSNSAPSWGAGLSHQDLGLLLLSPLDAHGIPSRSNGHAFFMAIMLFENCIGVPMGERWKVKVIQGGLSIKELCTGERVLENHKG